MIFSLDIKNEKEFPDIDEHEKIAIAADMIGSEICKDKTPEFLEGRIFCIHDKFLAEFLSQHLQNQVFKALQETHEAIITKMNKGNTNILEFY